MRSSGASGWSSGRSLERRQVDLSARSGHAHIELEWLACRLKQVAALPPIPYRAEVNGLNNVGIPRGNVVSSKFTNVNDYIQKRSNNHSFSEC